MFTFTTTDKELSRYEAFTSGIDAVRLSLEEYAQEEDLASIEKLKSNFLIKTKDFFRENRKLNIGVVGQVKAGKSSFLNTLLFDGKEILPKASTPKTATLTKMEYAEENLIEIEYYSTYDWSVLEDNSVVDSDDEIYVSAREIVHLARKNGIDPAEYLSKGTERIQFDTYEDLISQLNNYVGEDGTYTPVVKAVTLYLNKEEFQGISIVDTPGLNDPIISRTSRTKEFLEVCDVIFFLSQSGSFLDKSDWELLSSQLPQKGVKRLVLIASKYDSGIRDILRKNAGDDIFGRDQNTADNIPDACRMISRKLKKRAREKVEEFEKDLIGRGCPQEMIDVVRECKKPILVSAMACNMAAKPVECYSAEEQNVYDAIAKFSDNVQADLELLGNMDSVRDIFGSVIEEKEHIMLEKSVGFIPAASEELRGLLDSITGKARNRLAMLTGNDLEQLLAQKQAMEEQINQIKADITTAFGEWMAKLESEKAEGIRELRTAAKEYNSLSERTGTVTRTGSYSVSTSKWYNPFSWGTSRTEYYTYEEHYSYLSASDAVDNLRNFVLDAANMIEEVFTEAVNIREMKRKLLNIIVNNFDMGSEKYDPALFRIVVEETVNKIEFPVIRMDFSEDMNKIAAEFSGEITSASAKVNLRDALSNAISKFFEAASAQMERSVAAFKGETGRISGGLQTKLLDNISKEFDCLIEKYADREREIGNQKKYITKLETEIKKLREEWL